ncbi:MAG: DUF3592 domain-containing protein [Luteolibacter sp.]
MKIACYIFITLISLVNVVAGLKQAYVLLRKKIRICDGRIVLSKVGEVEEWYGGDNELKMFWPVVEFEYVLIGRTMRGDRISLASSKTSKRSQAEKKMCHYPEGKRVRVFYNADDPAECYLKNPRQQIATFLAWAAGMIVFGAVMNLMIWKFVP